MNLYILRIIQMNSNSRISLWMPMWAVGLFNKHRFNDITLKHINMYSDPSTFFNPPDQSRMQHSWLLRSRSYLSLYPHVKWIRDFRETCYGNSATGGCSNTILYVFSTITNNEKKHEQTFGAGNSKETTAHSTCSYIFNNFLNSYFNTKLDLTQVLRNSSNSPSPQLCFSLSCYQES